MQNSDADHVALISAIENGEFDEASKILTRDSKNRYVHPVGALQSNNFADSCVAGKYIIDLLNRLYEKGADINRVDKLGRCTLYYAAHNGNTLTE